MIAEPEPGTTVEDSKGHMWHRYPDAGWIGCLRCGGSESWTWSEIVTDCRGYELIIYANPSSAVWFATDHQE